MKVMDLIALPKHELGLMMVALAGNPPKCGLGQVDCWEALGRLEKKRGYNPTTQLRREALELIRQHHADGKDVAGRVLEIQRIVHLSQYRRQFGSPTSDEYTSSSVELAFDTAVETLDMIKNFDHARVAAIYHAVSTAHASMDPEDMKAWEAYRSVDAPKCLPSNWEYLSKE